MNKLMSCSFICVLVFCSLSFAQTREQKVKDDKTKNEASGFWHYNNFTKGVEDAKINKKPMMVVLRCLPCEECVKLDDELMEKDTVIKSLLEKFVRVRIVGTNGLDLSLFQFDYDQSFAIMFLNADGTIYGRYGT
ncbi:MAG: thioredoxin family protein [Gemmataceae bacterium]|nr:thioredoxin family protein [Gemmataceae bacterium]